MDCTDSCGATTTLYVLACLIRQVCLRVQRVKKSYAARHLERRQESVIRSITRFSQEGLDARWSRTPILETQV